MVTTLNITPLLSGRAVETITSAIMALVGLFIFSTVSYLINDLLKDYKNDESIKTTWASFVVEALLTFVVFYQIQSMFIMVSNSLFNKISTLTTLPHIYAAILSIFAVTTFQPSLSIRAKKIWSGVFGRPTRPEYDKTMFAYKN